MSIWVCPVVPKSIPRRCRQLQVAERGALTDRIGIDVGQLAQGQADTVSEMTMSCVALRGGLTSLRSETGPP
jgi:hypothetical protein